MNHQDRFDELIQKYLHCWSVFLAACGRIWEKTKTYAGIAGRFLQKYWKLLTRKVAAWLLKARAFISRYGKQALQKLAALALKIREKAHPKLIRAKEWAAAQMARVQRYLPAKAKELPPAEVAGETAALPAAAEEVSAAVSEADVEAEVVEILEKEPVRRESRQPCITNPTLLKIFAVLGIIGKYIKLVIKWIWKLRTVFMAIPVIWASVSLAIQNMVRLPDSVGLDIQASGEFARTITREQAVFWPLALTGFCLVLMFCSKKPLLPWIVSIFTLVMPVLIWVLNSYA